jgi:hypothetical protein
MISLTTTRRYGKRAVASKTLASGFTVRLDSSLRKR